MAPHDPSPLGELISEVRKLTRRVSELEARVNRMKAPVQEQGVCPMPGCGESLTYEGYQMKDDSLCYEVWCPNEKCNWVGTEWYRTEYDNTADPTGMPL